MTNKSKWILCAKGVTDPQWRILGYIEPQPDSDRLHAKISKHYAGYEDYGIWITSGDVVIRSSFAPSKEVTPVSRVFKNNEFIKGYADIVEGMVFSNVEDEKEKPIRVLAAKEGFVMLAREKEQPFVLHWKKLVAQYKPDVKR